MPDSSQSTDTPERLVITRTDVPSLFNVFPPGEPAQFNLTINQVRAICARHGWDLSSIYARLVHGD